MSPKHGKYALHPTIRAVLADMGVSLSDVLRRAGLPLDLLARGQVWLSQEEFFGLWQSIELEIDDPAFPASIGDAFAPNAFAAPVFAAMVSSNLNTAAMRIAKYKKLVGPVQLDVAIEKDATTISYRWPVGSTPPRTMVIAESMFWVAVARAGTRSKIDATRVRCMQLPDALEAHRDFFGVDLEASDHQSITFSASDASRPFLTADEGVWQTFEPELRRQLSELEAEAASAERVRAVLLELLPVGRTTLAEVASELATSTRTLHRRLQHEGTTFQKVLDTTREDLARHYLKNPGLSAAEIAFLLGYEEPTSFYRAFNNWTGETPDRVRSGV